MKTFEVNDDGDWTLGVVEGDAELIQNIKHLFYTRIGEWFLDQDQGFLMDVVEKKMVTESEILQASHDTLYQEPRVLEVVSVVFDLDRAERSLSMSFVVRTAGGTVGGDMVADI